MSILNLETVNSLYYASESISTLYFFVVGVFIEKVHSKRKYRDESGRRTPPRSLFSIDNVNSRFFNGPGCRSCLHHYHCQRLSSCSNYQVDYRAFKLYLNVRMFLVMACEFDLVTAVLGGSNTLELRWFSTEELLEEQEYCLTLRLCRLMDGFFNEWRL